MVDFKLGQFLYPFSILSFKRELKRCAKMSFQELVSLQDQKLRDLITYASTYVPFYRRFFQESGIRPQKIQTQRDLEVLPIITKQMIRENIDDFLSDLHSKYNSYLVSTSGSTGDALQFYVGKDSRVAIFTLMWNAWNINGYRPYDRWMNFKGYAFSDGELMKSSRVANCVGVPCCAITDEVASRIYDKLTSFRPKHVMGYSSFIYDFCRRFKEDPKLKNLGIKQVSTNSEKLYDFQRDTIQETFGCKVFNIYHQVEQVCFIFECEQQVKHLAHEYGILEVVDNDGMRIPNGQVGSMVCTGFFNRVMPFIRYKLDDLIIVSESKERCSCGLYHEVIESLEGRIFDTIVSKSGNRYNHMDAAFRNIVGLSGMQIVQDELSALNIKLVKNRLWRDAMLSDLASDINKYTQDEFDLGFQFVAELDKTANGKQRFIVSNLAEEYLK